MATRNNNPRNQDFDASINARPVTPDEVAYRDGYVSGKSADQLEQERRRAEEARVHEENAKLRTDNGISTGLILGLVLAAVAVVVGAVAYVYSDANDGAIISVPQAPAPEVQTPEPPNETTIIERTIERTQEVVPAPSNVEPPEINVELNNPVQQAPSAAPAAPSAAPSAAPAAPSAAPAAPSAAPANQAQSEAEPTQAAPQDTQPQ
ncbi:MULTISPECIES: hypothetical protein [Cyanophyceae]|uniref:hypothetical protein n=1 Tax=Cyanophyceae TaxID=3028117 RepID=UPI001683955A|nr:MULTISPECIES: hypothetical protein [Cyanophyceae]MBD1915539.1 hypothetical protein [Phormidium sp. FACHB-77]MBD2031849.1 hypothetical protein [Phormidium sp. FACHB-322]MBD2050599.1 hypothetical protein [Leptolyngbya sp. FACHB-60]